MSIVTLPLIALDRRRKLFRAILFVISGILAMFALALSARAESHVLILPPDDGYGFQECLTAKTACGEIIANAWCEASGLKASKSFGRAEDLRARAGEDQPADAGPGSFYVACGDEI